MPVRIGKPSKISGELDIATGPSYSSAIGLSQWKRFGSDLNKEAGKGFVKDTINNVKNFFNEFF